MDATSQLSSDQNPSSWSPSLSHLIFSLLSPGPLAQWPQMLGETTIFTIPSFIFATSISESSGLYSHCQRAFFFFRFLPTDGKYKLSSQIKRVFLLWWPAWELWSPRCKSPGVKHLQIAKYRASPTNFQDLYGINLSLCAFRVVHASRQAQVSQKFFIKSSRSLYPRELSYNFPR